MSNETTVRRLSEFEISDYTLIDTTILPKDYPKQKRKSADIINFEIERKTYQVKRFSKAIEYDPENALAWFNRGLAYFNQALSCNGAAFRRAIDHAIKDFTKAIDLTYLVSYNNRAVTYLTIGEYGAALNDFGSAITHLRAATAPALREQVALALFNKAIALGKTHKHKEALDVYKELLDDFISAINPTLRWKIIQTLIDQGFTLDGLGDHELALDVYKTVIDRFADETDVNTHAQVGVALVFKARSLAFLGKREISQGKFEEGCACYSEAIQIDGAKKGETKIDIEAHILRYYGIDQQEDNPSNGFNLPTRVMTAAELRELASDTATLIVERLSSTEKPSFPILSEKEVAAIVARTHEIFTKADLAFHARLATEISRDGLPEWLGLSTATREIAPRETGLRTAEAPAASLPFPHLTDEQLAAAYKYGQAHLWDNRREDNRRTNGYPWRTDVFEYVAETYAKWIPGLTQGHLKHIDRSLYRKLTKEITARDGRPDWFKVPSDYQARDLVEQDAGRKAVREYHRDRARRYRENLSKQAPKK